VGDVCVKFKEIQMENIGEYLKEIRLSKKLTIENISNQTKLKTYIIEQIENNDFNAIGDVGFIKIMIITYCRAVEGNEESVQKRLAQLFDKPSEPPIKIQDAKNEKAVIISPNAIYFVLLGVLIICLTVAIIHLYRSDTFSFNAIREQLAATERRVRPTPQESEQAPDSLWIMQRRIFYETNEIVADEERQVPVTARVSLFQRSTATTEASSRVFNVSNHYVFDNTDYVGEMIFNHVISPLNPEILEFPVRLAEENGDEEY